MSSGHAVSNFAGGAAAVVESPRERRLRSIRCSQHGLRADSNRSADAFVGQQVQLLCLRRLRRVLPRQPSACLGPAKPRACLWPSPGRSVQRTTWPGASAFRWELDCLAKAPWCGGQHGRPSFRRCRPPRSRSFRGCHPRASSVRSKACFPKFLFGCSWSSSIAAS